MATGRSNMAIGLFGSESEYHMRRADLADLDALARLAVLLWPNHDFAELKQALDETLNDPEAAFFLCFSGDCPVGFAQCQLRHEYVEGTSGRPVGYLEGVYVAERDRKKGLAKGLLRQCEEWCLSKGCAEFASDCELSNETSHAFHTKSGFREVNRIVCFVKKIEP